VVTAFVPACPKVESAPSGEVTATVGTAGGGGGGEPTGTFGNNLSFPLVFADSYGIAGAKITGTWPGVGPFATLPTFDYNTGLRPLSTETLTAFRTSIRRRRSRWPVSSTSAGHREHVAGRMAQQRRRQPARSDRRLGRCAAE